MTPFLMGVLTQAALPAGCYDVSDQVNSYDLFARAEVDRPTPDAAEDLGYRGYLTARVTGNMVNFFNAADYALATGTYPGVGRTNWEANEETYKPDSLPWGNYAYDFTLQYPTERRGFVNYLGSIRFVDDHLESVSFIARPRSKAAGALGTIGGAVALNVDIGPASSSGFTDTRPDHSGQFSRPIQGLQPYYSRLLEETD
jgi:hypothetical protein